MPEDITTTDATCEYCGHHLDSRVYFCPSCAKPHRSVETFLPASFPAYEDTETALRTKAPQAWTVFFTFLSVIGVFGSFAYAIFGMEEEEPAILIMDFALFLTTIFFTVRFWSDLRPMLARIGLFHPVAWIGLVLLAPLLAINYGYHHFLVELLAIEMEDYNSFFSSNWGPIVFICISPAIIEEIAFRGIIQHQFEQAVKPWIAIGVGALLFSAAHFTILSAPYLALVGILLGWMKWKTGSLYPSMIAHFLHNFVAITYFQNLG